MGFTSKGTMMATSAAKIQANQANAAKSTGPKTAEGKAKSRRNSLKHGMTGAGIVLPEADAAEVARRTAKYGDELAPVGEVGEALVRRVALNSVRMERGADQQTAALTRRVRQVEAEFVAPEGVDENEAAQLKAEAVRIAMFDPSKEAALARQYEAAAERAFYRALKQLRQMELQSEALLREVDAKESQEAMMASFLAARQVEQTIDDEMDALYPELALPTTPRTANSAQFTSMIRGVDVPITVGRPR